MKRANNQRSHLLKNILENPKTTMADNLKGLETNPHPEIQEDLMMLGIKEVKEKVREATREEVIEETTEELSEKVRPPCNVSTMPFSGSMPNPAVTSSAQLAQSIMLFDQLIDKELVKAATVLGLEPAELKAWVNLQIEVPAKTILNLLRTMQSLYLDPLNEEIGFTQYEDGRWQVFITIEGCSKLLNQHSQFHGLTFTQSDTMIDGVPEWIECSIYRRDRIVPITVREHLSEVRTENAIWQKMPRRMLRHRALQQCVRLAIAYNNCSDFGLGDKPDK